MRTCPNASSHNAASTRKTCACGIEAGHVVERHACVGGGGLCVCGDGPLRVAQRCIGGCQTPRRLHRNFQGYSTQPDCDLIALGVSSIGRVGPTFSQNVKTLDEYYDLLNQGRLPVARGMALSRDDLVRRTVIMALMCQGSVLLESVELSHLVDFKQYFASEMENMAAMQDQGLLTVDDAGIHVTELGWFFVRGVAMVFDKYLQADKNRARFSKII